MQFKKLILVIDNLNIGGIATSFYNFLNYNHEKYNISILVFDQESIDLNRIPEDVIIVKPPKRLLVLAKTQKEIFYKSFLLWVIRLFCVFFSSVFGGCFSRKMLFLGLRKIGNYDYALAYSHDNGHKKLTTGCSDFVIKKINAITKGSYIHCDYNNAFGYSRSDEKKYSKFDQLLCVSNSCKSSFLSCFPKLSYKTLVLYNFYDLARIIKMSESFYIYDNKYINFITICRLTHEKGITRCLDAFNRIFKERPLLLKKIRWYIVGSGPLESSLNDKVNSYKLTDNIIFLGNQTNPYYYLKNSDCFVLPSFHEAAPMVFGECEILNVPIITTDTISAKEIVEGRGIGIVCDNSMEGLYNSILMFIENGFVQKEKSDDINFLPSKQLEKIMGAQNE